MGGRRSNEEGLPWMNESRGRRTRVSSTTQLAPAVPDSHLPRSPLLPLDPSIAKAYEAAIRGKGDAWVSRRGTKLFHGEKLSIRGCIDGPVSTLMGTISGYAGVRLRVERIGAQH